MLGKLASQLWWRRTLARNAQPWDELERFPQLPVDQQRRILAERLLTQIQYFGPRGDALPEWRDAAGIRDPDELWRQWSSLPIVDRSMLQTRFSPHEMQARFKLVGRVDSTGGSTGQPTPFFHNPEMLRARLSASVYSRLRMGWRPGMATIIVWGSERDIGKQTSLRARIGNRIARNFVIEGYHLTQDTVRRVLGLVQRFSPVAMYGFTSMLEFVARETLTIGALPAGNVQVAWNGGEMMFPEQAEVFRRAFGAPLLNRYGGRELSVIACQYRENGPLEIVRPWLFVEIVDEQGKPVAPGEAGRVLCTSTICQGTPFLRYELGDLAESDPAAPAEAGVSTFRKLLGRTASLLKLPNGKTINNLYWNHLFKEFAEARQFQVVLKRDGGLHFILVGQGFSPEREAELRSVLTNFLGDLSIQFQWVDKIPLTRQGKLIQVVRESAEEQKPN